LNSRHALAVLLALTFQAVLPSALRGAFSFTITDLGTLGGSQSSASAVNDYGQVAGTSTTPYGVSRAFGYSGGVMYDLGTLGGDYSSASAINARGQVVGTATTSTGASHAFLFASDVMTDLGTLGGNSSSANAINNNGLIVGTSMISYGVQRAFLFANGVMYDLGTLGGDYSTATAINDGNVVVGTSGSTNPPNPDNGNDYGFVFLNGRIQNLAILGGPEALYVFPSCLSNSGQIAGTYTASIGEIGLASFIYSGGATAYLGSGISEALFAKGINNGGQVVGSDQSLAGGPQYGFLYAGGVILDLNTLVDLSGSNFSHLSDATAISNTGCIVGTGTTKNGNSHAYLLTPTPGP
jgi:probable HAF family extracellular repeat protein